MIDIKITEYSTKYESLINKLIIDSFYNSYHTNSIHGDIRKEYLINKIIQPYISKSNKNCLLLFKNSILVSGIIFGKINFLIDNKKLPGYYEIEFI